MSFILHLLSKRALHNRYLFWYLTVSHPLSEARLKIRSELRLAGSAEPSQKFLTQSIKILDVLSLLWLIENLNMYLLIIF